MKPSPVRTTQTNEPNAVSTEGIRKASCCKFPSQISSMAHSCSSVKTTLQEVAGAFYKRAVACCFPKKGQVASQKDQVKFVKCSTGEGDQLILMQINGKMTENGLHYTKKSGCAHIHFIYVEEKGLAKHLPALFDKLLHQEGVETLSTQIMQFAKTLYDCGFVSTTPIRYNPKDKGKMHKEITDIIDQARAKKDQLNQQNQETLANVERDISPRGPLASFVDLGTSMIAGEGYDLSPVDLFALMEAVDYSPKTPFKMGSIKRPLNMKFTRPSQKA